MNKLIERLRAEGILRTPSIINAFGRVDREWFVTEDMRDQAGLNQPLPIGYGQTISQPLTVAFMLELLQPSAGNKVLDVGAGSGWTAALLQELVGKKGEVFAIERIPQLKMFAENNLKRAGYESVRVFGGDGSKGLPDHAPFERIHVAAASVDIPRPLLDQLAVGGRLVIPLGQYVQDVVLVERRKGGQYHEQRFPGFQFVPLVKDEDQ